VTGTEQHEYHCSFEIVHVGSGGRQDTTTPQALSNAQNNAESVIGAVLRCSEFCRESVLILTPYIWNTT
jgi:hypothetical protein